MNGLVVYTAITNAYDVIRTPPKACRGVASFVAYLDRPAQFSGWEVREACKQFSDPSRNAKMHKILPHVYLGDVQYSLWIDGSVEIKEGFAADDFISKYLADVDFAVFRHRKRTCIYQEAKACIEQGKDSPEIIRRQVDRYFEEGYPANAGLAECTVLLRRHTAQVKQFDEMWHGEIVANSKRDQLSFNYVARKTGFRFNYISGTISKNPHFLWRRHR